VAGNHRGAALLPDHRDRRHRQLDDAVQARDDPLDAAAVLDVNHRKARRVERVARDDDVRTAEEHEAVGVAVRCGLIEQLHGLAVDEHVLAVLAGRRGIRRRGPHGFRKLRLPARRRAHAVLHVLFGQDGRAAAVRRHVVQAAGRHDRFARARELLVAAHVVQVGVGVDDVADRLSGELSDLGQHQIGPLGEAGVHDHDAVGADLDGDVRTRPRNHVEVGPHLQRFEFHRRGRRGAGRRPLRRRDDRGRRHQCRDSGQQARGTHRRAMFSATHAHFHAAGIVPRSY
jgi:hypothetical protein